MVRRTFSGEFGQQVVFEAMETGDQSLAARRCSLGISLPRKRVRRYQEGGELTPTQPNATPGVVTAKESLSIRTRENGKHCTVIHYILFCLQIVTTAIAPHGGKPPNLNYDAHWASGVNPKLGQHLFKNEEVAQ